MIVGGQSRSAYEMIVFNLQPAERGLPNSSGSFRAVTRVMSASFRNRPFSRLQGKYCDLICKSRLTNNNHWCSLLVRRFAGFGYCISEHDVNMYVGCISSVLNSIPQKRRKGVAMMFIKTLSNSWFTSNRMHEEVRLPCIMGCEACEDRLVHYIHCAPLWDVVCTAMRRDNAWASLLGIERLGFPNPDPCHLYLFGVMFKTCHALRFDFAPVINGCIADDDFSAIHCKALFLANFFASDFLC